MDMKENIENIENSRHMYVNYFKFKTVCLASVKYSCHDAQAVLRLKPIWISINP